MAHRGLHAAENLCRGILVAACLSLPLAGTASDRPNSGLFLMDEMGWRNVGIVGNPYVEPPNIDCLKKQGLVSAQTISTAPNCAPARACPRLRQVDSHPR
uniref:Sulfatase N-terminal domain-containing protein n=1 Tax=Schlesneria paludicola TaxID=360056 RepID=A0A7C2K080_9PLAN